MDNVDLELVEWLANQNRVNLAAILYDYSNLTLTELQKKKRGWLARRILEAEVVPTRFKRDTGRN